MNVLFLIYTGRHGQGGHLHSLNTISRKIAEGHDVKVVTIGRKICAVLEENPYFDSHIYSGGASSFFVPLKVMRKCRSGRFDIIHCFDYPSFYYASFSDLMQSITIVNRCGGPNPLKSPYVRKLIVFSEENERWFKKKSPKSQVVVVPNRVEKREPSYYLKRNILTSWDSFVFIRTCRISEAYRKSILDSCRLVEELSLLSNRKVKLLLVGDIQSKSLFEYVSTMDVVKKGMVELITDEELTKETAKHLNVADAIIGVGRSAAEAAALSKPVLAIDSSGRIPVLLSTESQWKCALRTNVSERNKFRAEDQRKNLELILRMISDDAYYNAISKLSFKFFSSFYSSELILDKYSKFYHSDCVAEKPGLKDSFKRIYGLAKQIFNDFFKR